MKTQLRRAPSSRAEHPHPAWPKCWRVLQRRRRGGSPFRTRPTAKCRFLHMQVSVQVNSEPCMRANPPTPPDDNRTTKTHSKMPGLAWRATAATCRHRDRREKDKTQRKRRKGGMGATGWGERGGVGGEDGGRSSKGTVGGGAGTQKTGAPRRMPGGRQGGRGAECRLRWSVDNGGG